MFRIVILLLLFSLLFSCQRGNDSWARIEQAGILRVGLDPSYPPFENLVEGELVGLDVDLMRQLGDDLGLEVHFDIIGYDGLYDALLTGRVDVLASALIVDETRTKTFAYGEPYFNAGQVLVVAHDSLIRGQADLDNQAVAVELGAAGHVVLTEWVKSAENLQIVPLDTTAAALDAVSNPRVAAAIVDSISGRIAVAQTPTLKIVDDAITVEPFSLVTRRTDNELRRQLDNALKTLIDNGQLDKIHQRWLSPK